MLKLRGKVFPEGHCFLNKVWYTGIKAFSAQIEYWKQDFSTLYRCLWASGKKDKYFSFSPIPKGTCMSIQPTHGNFYAFNIALSTNCMGFTMCSLYWYTRAFGGLDKRKSIFFLFSTCPKAPVYQYKDKCTNICAFNSQFCRNCLFSSISYFV